MPQRYLAFENKKKTSENQPDYRIFVNPGKDGQLSRYSIGAIWIQEGKKGNYLSLSIEDEEYNPEDAPKKSFKKSESKLTSKLKKRKVVEEDEDEDDEDEDDEESDDEDTDEDDDSDEEEEDKDESYEKKRKKKTPF